MSHLINSMNTLDQTIFVVLACEPCEEQDAHVHNLGMSFIFSDMQTVQSIEDAYTVSKDMAKQNPKATMHSILAMTPKEIDAMIQRVQGGTFS